MNEVHDIMSTQEKQATPKAGFEGATYGNRNYYMQLKRQWKEYVGKGSC